MSATIGIRELKNRASHVLRTVREQGAAYVITVRGEPAAILRPFTDEDAARLHQTEVDEALAEMKTLAQEVAAAWTSPKSAVELVEEQRRG